MKTSHKIAALGSLTAVAGAAACWKWMIRMPLKEFTRYALYMAALDDEICRNELEGNQIGGEVITFPPKAETLQGGVDIPADGVPRLPAEFSVHQAVKIIPLRGALEQKGVSLPKAGAGARLGVGQVVLLIVLKYLCLQYCDSAFVLHRFVLLGCLHFGLPVR